MNYNLNTRIKKALIQTFGVNNLNELSSVTRSGTLTVTGTTTSTATNVTVNSLTGALYNDKTFAKDGFTVTNGNNTYTAIAQDSYNRKDTNSVVFNLPSTVNYIYDLNGNLPSDNTRVFDYDDENELIRVTVTNTWKSELVYDGRMRRRIRKEFTWQNSAWLQTNEVRYIYDGNLEIQWRDANNLPTLTLTSELDGPTIAAAVPASDKRLGTASRLRSLLESEQSSPTSDSTSKRPAHLVALSRLTWEGRGKLFHSVPSGSNSVMDATASYVENVYGKAAALSILRRDSNKYTPAKSPEIWPSSGSTFGFGRSSFPRAS